MTPEQLAAIAARNAARTPGKWELDQSHPGMVYCDDATGQRVCDCNGTMTFFSDKQIKDNAAFIAHASEDIPALLAEVARLQASLAEAEKRVYDAAKEQAMQQVRYDCRACSGTGHADAETECEYCGRPMQSIAAMVRP